MDTENIADLKRLAPKKNCHAKILMLGDFDPENDRIIRDPYYVSTISVQVQLPLFFVAKETLMNFQDDGSAGFEKCYNQCVRCCKAFLDKVIANEI